MRNRNFGWLLVAVAIALAPGIGLAQQAASNANASQSSSAFEQVVERIVQKEKALVESLRGYSPLIETYIQVQRSDKDLGKAPANDYYFLGKANLQEGTVLRSLTNREPGIRKKFLGVFNVMSPAIEYQPAGFLEMIYVDSTSFDRANYEFNYVRREFLGEVRCLVFDIAPVKNAPKGRFRGRIWVDDQEFSIVRFNGVYDGSSARNMYFHFDSWRVQVGQGQWLPAFIYSEETSVKGGMFNKTAFKAQSRLWGYDLARSSRQDEFSQILVEAANPVRDESETSKDRTPVQAQRLWDRQAEENVLERLERVGLLAPKGEVDTVLDTVVNNLLVTNNLNIEPEVRSRVLLTSTLEAFTLGHTIILSRGLIDTLPDEPSLAAILAQQLGHITAGHGVDGKYAFNDQLIFPDDETLRRLNFRRSEEEVVTAGNKGLELLKNSPYKDKLGNAGLYLATLNQRSKELPALIHANMGNPVLSSSELVAAAPALEMGKVEQISALPLGARVKMDPWSSRIELVRGKAVQLVSAREKMPFEVSPFMIYLTRQKDAKGNQSLANTNPGEVQKKPDPQNPQK